MSRPKNAVRAAEDRDLLKSLLRHGAHFLSPSDRILSAAAKLEALGLITLAQSEVTKCANPNDRDFPPRTRDCHGLVVLRPDADEAGGDYRCPACSRIVYPARHRKQRFDRLMVQHVVAGIEAYLIEECGQAAEGHGFHDGALSLPVNGFNGTICIVDYMTDVRWNQRSMAAGQIVVYVAISQDKFDQILDDQAIERVELVDVVLGKVDLRSLLGSRINRPPELANLDLPVSTLGLQPVLPGARSGFATPRIFNLHFSQAGFHVNGHLAIRNDQQTSIKILGILAQQYVDALMGGGEVKPLIDAELAERLGIPDARTAARQLLRTRNSIVKTVRRDIGLPIDEHDVIETASRSGFDRSRSEQGYRLNPRSVALGPIPRDGPV